jgi:hypothetical protein
MRAVVLAACVGAACAGALRDEVRAQFCIGWCTSDTQVSYWVQGVIVCLPPGSMENWDTGVITLAGATIYTPGQNGNKCPPS